MKTIRDTHILLALLLVVFAAFGNSLGNGFVYDDHALIEENPALRSQNYFTTVFSHSFSKDVSYFDYSKMPIDYYRPFTRMLFGVAFDAFGLQARYWHLLNIALYCAVVALAYLIIRQLSGNRLVAGAGALLFAVHPIHSEAVAWVSCLVETLHALFFLGAFALYLQAEKEKKTDRERVFYIGSLVLVMGALLSKETALCFPILIAAYRFIYDKDLGLGRRIWSSVRASVPYLLAVTGYFLLRYSTYGGFLRIGKTLPLHVVLLTIPGVVLEYLRMLVFPLGLSLIHSVPLVGSLASLSFWLPLLLVAVMVLICLRAPRTIAFVCAWILVTMLPVLNLGAFTLDLMIQSRYAFLPSLGFCAAVAMGLKALFERGIPAWARPALVAVFILVVGALFGLTVRQNRYWYSDLTLYARAAQQNPNSEIAQCNYGWVLYHGGDKEEAARHFTASFKITNGESACGCVGLGRYYADHGDYSQAIQFYENAIELGGGDVDLLLFANLAYAYNRNGRTDKAIELLTGTLKNRPDFQHGYYTLAGILLDAGRVDEGIKQLQRALELNPRDAGARLLLGQAYEGRGLRKEAAEQYRLALAITPDLEPARARLSDLER